MSAESARSFLRDLETKQDLQNKIVPAFDMDRGDWNHEKLTALASEVGYSFSMDELKTVTLEIYGTTELSEEQLEMISGGFACCCTCTLPCCCCCQVV